MIAFGKGGVFPSCFSFGGSASKEVDVALTHLPNFNLAFNPLLDEGHILRIVIDRHSASSSAGDHTIRD
ncbi:hypothetical protein LCM4573_26150 [Rhizobium sp. LCM 4573]|nr:hypothetical protein LCM4573_26150 [Rhizobium sp. LCM 4573]